MTAAPLLDLTGHPIIAHRGASGTAPENTIAAFDRARDLGVDGFELDIRLSADGLAVVHHDATLDRTTDGSGPLAHRSLAELERVDAGARFTTDGREFPFRARGVGIPTLRQVLDRYPDTPLLIELKVPEAAPVVRDELLRAGAANRAVVASFLSEAVTLFHQPPILAGASRRDSVSLFWRALVG
ncbi:MAG: glycerophosphodiester phosphodiesterase family protein, partial [Gemmatimonadales bacterium]